MTHKQDVEHKKIKKQVTLQFLENLLTHIKNDDHVVHEKNKSYLYLENETLNIFLQYFLAQLNSFHSNHSNKKDIISTNELDELSDNLTEMIEKNKQQFESVITLLKEKLHVNDSNS